jgi:hypothetical protein
MVEKKIKGDDRVDELGRAFAGSQLQIQIYVNRYKEKLEQRILEKLPALSSLKPSLEWVSPIENKKFIEYQDEKFLETVGLGAFAGRLREFWPKGGPHWDALAKIELPQEYGRRGILLVEAKSYPGEIYQSGCKATPESRKRIEAAINNTKDKLKVTKDADWTGPLYQYANRLAHLYFFREVINIPAWLVNIYFLEDPQRPTNIGEWKSALTQVKAALGLADKEVPLAADIFLEAKNRNELIEK